MAANLLNLMKSMPEAKFVVSAHNGHINVNDTSWVTTGTVLSEKLEKQYYAICFETSQGLIRQESGSLRNVL